MGDETYSKGTARVQAGEVRRLDIGTRCPHCGSRSVVALMRSIWAWGVDGGSATCDRQECDACGAGWAV